MYSIKWLYYNREKVIKTNDQNFYLKKLEKKSTSNQLKQKEVKIEQLQKQWSKRKTLPKPWEKSINPNASYLRKSIILVKIFEQDD